MPYRDPDATCAVCGKEIPTEMGEWPQDARVYVIEAHTHSTMADHGFFWRICVGCFPALHAFLRQGYKERE